MLGMYHNSYDENESRDNEIMRKMSQGITSLTKKVKMCLRKSCGN